MIVSPSAQSQSTTVLVIDDSGLPVGGLVAATFPPTYYVRNGEAAVAISLSDLATITSAYSSGGVKEYSGGRYRLDYPNAMIATPTQALFIGEASGKHIVHPMITCAYFASQFYVVDSVQAAPAPSAAVFAGSAALNGTVNTAYQNSYIVFITGANAGEAHKIASYVASTRTFTMTNGYPVAPTAGDAFAIIARNE